MLSTPEVTPSDVLLVEDDAVLRERVLIPRLTEYGFTVSGVETVRELYQSIAISVPTLVVLDVGLPDGDGFASAAWMKKHFPRTGIIMLTGRSGAGDHVHGLQQGADAYLTKPVEPEVLAATLHSVRRRLQPPSSDSIDDVAHRGWRMDSEGWCLVDPVGARIPLTRTERKLMLRLLSSKGKVVSRESLIKAITDNTHEFDPHRLDSLIHRVRKKVLCSCGKALPLTSVHGEGYVFTQD